MDENNYNKMLTSDMHRTIDIPVSSFLEARIHEEGTSVFARLYNRLTKCEHPLSLINFDDLSFSRLSKLPFNTIYRFIYVNPSSLQIAYANGLQGGGCCCGSKVICKRDYSEKDLIELRQNQIRASDLADDIVEQLRRGAFEEETVDKLCTYNPYKCNAPFAIGNILLKSFNSENLWISGERRMQYREKLASLIRRFFMSDFIRNRNSTILSNQTLTEYKDILHQTMGRVKNNQKYFLESTTLLEIKVIEKLACRAKDTQMWYQGLFKHLKDIVNAIISLKNENPGPIILKLIEGCNIISNNFTKNESLAYMVIFDEMEKKIAEIRSDSEVKNTITEFLYKEIAKKQEKWKPFIILLDFIKL